ncbi:MAG: hypothetical protein CVV30_03720 [Methanomicrobiales archaeon HGW-Methanomicrobiales-1]|nr:MAG: hypothetical protein CVV30_03720 [Methanomicrobiales archaeon HGW-Methanomicrobiales-1]
MENLFLIKNADTILHGIKHPARVFRLAKSAKEVYLRVQFSGRFTLSGLNEPIPKKGTWFFFECGIKLLPDE